MVAKFNHPILPGGYSMVSHTPPQACCHCSRIPIPFCQHSNSDSNSNSSTHHPLYNPSTLTDSPFPNCNLL
ncbi:hypothetical protein L6452_40150 [Arctium lappa]|uniref:Uncharacterized protein n=1 Tax=Arctium lappa TaxID=4217 RepID=A0ACB8XKM1_ARCLA|nr:hypothetical protein L6452_40150 [Arctium lappa]